MIITIIIITIIRAQGNRGVRNGSHRGTWTWRLKYRIIRKVLDMKKEKKKKRKKKKKKKATISRTTSCCLLLWHLLLGSNIRPESKKRCLDVTYNASNFFLFELVKYRGLNGVFLVFLTGAPINHINILKILSCFQYSNISVLHFSFWKCNGLSYK